MNQSMVMEELTAFGPQQRRAVSLSAARAYVRRLTQAHSENFSVVSWFLPRRYRPAFEAIYAFCRWADDLADESADPLELLDWWQDELDRCFSGQARHPVFVALAPVIEAHKLPREPFDDLIRAFRQDQQIHCYETWQQLLQYCALSANPVGRLILCLCDCRASWQWACSDATCTALQLTNFWQDVRRDLLHQGRIYIPQQIAAQNGLDLQQLQNRVAAGSGAAALDAMDGSAEQVRAYRATLRQVVNDTWPLFEEGKALWPSLPRDMLRTVMLFTFGGETVLRKIEKQHCGTLWRRPRLSRGHKLMLLGRAMGRNLR